MSRHDCDLCGRPQVDTAYACPDCTNRTRRDLEWLARNASEMNLAIAKQSRIGSSGSSGGDGTLPVDLQASYDRDAVRNVLTTWARDVLEHRTHLTWPADTIAGIAAWLAGQLDWLRHREYAADALDELSDAVALARRIVDSQEQRVYRGPCGADDPDTGETCTEDLYAPESAEVVRCRACGSETSSAARREWLLGSVRDQIVPAATVGMVIRAWTPHELGSSTIRQWVRRGRLIASHYDPGTGQPLYRVRDAIDLAEEVTRRRAKQAA